jgi:hypothetical protein
VPGPRLGQKALGLADPIAELSFFLVFMTISVKVVAKLAAKVV